MEELTVEKARDLLMEADILPMSAPSESSNGARADSVTEKGPATGVDENAGQADGQEAAAAAEGRSYNDSSVGLGVDIVEVERMKSILKRIPSFAERVFSPAERAYCERMSNSATHYALRFAAKEAVVKALGTGFSNGIGVRDIEVERAQSGRPSIRLSGRALEIAEEQGVRDLSISLSYTHSDAVACAMAVTEASARASEKRKDPMEELTKQFKEMRGMLDEL